MSNDYGLLWDQPGTDTIASWINRNAPNSKFFTWIAVSSSNKALEYKVNADQSKTVLDSRYYIPVAQFFAASSYGPLQTTLLPWNNATRKVLLNTVLQVDQEPLYVVCKDRQRGLNLGAIVDGSIATTNKGGTVLSPPCPGCTEDKWTAFWNAVLVKYNGAASYGPTVLKKAQSYEPVLK